MRVLICPDKFAGTLSAVQVAEAVAEGWRGAAPADQIVIRPLADGGPGFVEVLAAAVGGRRLPVPTVDPLGRPAAGEVLVTAGEVLVTGRAQPEPVFGGGEHAPGSSVRAQPEPVFGGGEHAPSSPGDTCYVESAQACGLHLLAEAERDPKVTTSYGLGTLIRAAADSGARRVVIGLGGSATNDAGAGMLAALGVVALDDTGQPLPPGGAALAGVAALRITGTVPGGVALVAATDVDSPLTGIHGASSVYGPQKGASREDVLLLDAALARFAGVLEAGLPGCPPGLADLPGAGAAGGLGAALLALGGRCESGIDLVRRRCGLDAELDRADLVITGEGSFDAQSLRGKVVAGVAGAARDRGLPCVVLAGRASAGRREAAAAGVTQVYSLVEQLGGVAAAMMRPAEGLRALGFRLAGQWSRREAGAAGQPEPREPH